MYFVLSKTFGEFFIPSTLVLLILLCGVILWWRGRAFMGVGRTLAVFGMVSILIGGQSQVSTALLVPLENRFPAWDPAGATPTGIVVLGGAINTHISHFRNETALNPSANRLIAAVELYRRYPESRIIFSGGNSNLILPGESESKYALQLLESLGVPRDKIALDANARNTFENAINAKKIAGPKPGERWLLITSALHMPRAMGLFRVAGFPIEAYPVDYRTGGWRDLKAVPTLSVFAGFIRLDQVFHEWVGLVVDRLSGRTRTLFPGPADASAAADGDAKIVQ